MPDPKRAEACRRAWDKIRANRAGKAAGLPVAEPAKTSDKPSLLPKINAWLEPTAPPVPDPIPEAPVVAPPVPELAAEPVKKLKVRRVKGSRGKERKARAA
jgi:hypothetical protein